MKCVVHVPFKIDKTYGSHLRVGKMSAAFESLGYQVTEIEGDRQTRQRQIQELAEAVRAGERYEFLYSESSTMPTLLTSASHLPDVSRLDFHFLKFCHEHKIPIGLFLRDIYWKFPVYKKSVPFLKRHAAAFFYRYDLQAYRKLLDVLYLPSLRMLPFVYPRGWNLPVFSLPPAYECGRPLCEQSQPDRLRLFYVGGISTDLYNLRMIMEAVQENTFLSFTLCCRARDWSSCHDYFKPYLCERTEIVHKSGDELEKLYENQDIGILFFTPSVYRSFAMPIKLFEYLAHSLPILCNEGTEAADYLADSGAGIPLPYDENALTERLLFLHQNRALLQQLKTRAHNFALNENWIARANQVADQLTACRDQTKIDG